MLHTEDEQILAAAPRNLVTRAIRHPGIFNLYHTLQIL